MDNKIQELTDKIYHEGVEKGNDEAKKIISAAKIEADKIINDAKNQAQEIISAAKKSSDEYADNTKSEIKLLQSGHIIKTIFKIPFKFYFQISSIL